MYSGVMDIIGAELKHSTTSITLTRPNASLKILFGISIVACHIRVSEGSADTQGSAPATFRARGLDGTLPASAPYPGSGAAAPVEAWEADVAINFRRLFFFGDSITDPGRLPEPFRPDPPYVGGRFTNGLVYAQILPRELGVSSTNFAFGGAKAVASEPEQLLIGLDAQVTAFEIKYFFGAPSGSAAVIFIGGNDLHDADPNDPRIVGHVLESIDDAAVRLARKGVDELILFNLPATSQTPRGLSLPASERAAEDALIAAYNAGLRELAAAYNDAGVPTTIVDANRLTREVAGDLSTFGLKVFDIPRRGRRYPRRRQWQ